MTQIKTTTIAVLALLAATYPAFAQEGQPQPADADTPWLIILIGLAAALVVIGAIASYVLKPAKEKVVVVKDPDANE